jgi:cell division septum initiation protein DivIVA
MAKTDLWESELVSLIDQAEDLLSEAPRVPLTGRAVVDAEGLLALLQHMRRILPEDLRQARWIVQERERLLADAQAEAKRAVGDARTQIDRLADEHTLTREAQAKADAILQQAQQAAREIHSGARQYADDVLATLVRQLDDLRQRVETDRAELHR